MSDVTDVELEVEFEKDLHMNGSSEFELQVESENGGHWDGKRERAQSENQQRLSMKFQTDYQPSLEELPVFIRSQEYVLGAAHDPIVFSFLGVRTDLRPLVWSKRLLMIANHPCYQYWFWLFPAIILPINLFDIGLKYDLISFLFFLMWSALEFTRIDVNMLIMIVTTSFEPVFLIGNALLSAIFGYWSSLGKYSVSNNFLSFFYLFAILFFAAVVDSAILLKVRYKAILLILIQMNIVRMFIMSYFIDQEYYKPIPYICFNDVCYHDTRSALERSFLMSALRYN